MELVVFEDPHVDKLRPVTTGRPAYAVSCGGCRLVDWLWQLQLPLHGLVRTHLREVQVRDYPQFQNPETEPKGPLALINARLVPSRATFDVLGRVIQKGRASAIWRDDQLAVAVLPEPASLDQVRASLDRIDEQAESSSAESSPDPLSLRNLPRLDDRLELVQYPHDLIRFNLETLSDNLEYRLTNGAYREIREGVFAADGAHLGEHVVSDTSHGPIVLERNARIGPYCYLSGPAHVGAHSRVIEHAAIKDGVSLGHTTKIGGEVEASIIEPYTNKQHHGFLGHSYLGSWINLGAGTCNSDLKNTYGLVKMEYGGEKVSTDMQFVGCIIGDYAKSAINTGIFTGKIIGTCSMVYGFVTTNVPSFVNYARLFGQVTELPPEVMVATQQRMFSRRDVQPRPCDAQLIHDMFELTRGERQMAGEPLSL